VNNNKAVYVPPGIIVVVTNRYKPGLHRALGGRMGYATSCYAKDLSGSKKLSD